MRHSCRDSACRSEDFSRASQAAVGDSYADKFVHSLAARAHRTHLAYRLHFLQRGEPKVVEQRVFITLGEHGIEKLDLVCSGFLPRRREPAQAMT